MDSGYQTDEDDDLAWESVVGDIRVNADQLIIVRCHHPDDSIEFEFWQECLRVILDRVGDIPTLVHLLSLEGAGERVRILLKDDNVSKTLTGFGMWYHVDHIVMEDFCQLSIAVRNNVKINYHERSLSPVPFDMSSVNHDEAATPPPSQTGPMERCIES